MSQELIGELKKQGQRLDILGRDIRAGFAITLGAVLLGGFLAYAGIIQTERIQHTANAYSDYLTAIVDGDCKKIRNAKARIAAHGSRDAVAAVAAVDECDPCGSEESQRLLIEAVMAIQDHMRPFSEATAERKDVGDLLCPVSENQRAVTFLGWYLPKMGETGVSISDQKPVWR